MIEIGLSDRIGDLTLEQIDHLARGLEHAHELTLKDAGGGRYWLETLDGGALLLRTDRTVDHVWKCAEAISAEASPLPAWAAGVGGEFPPFDESQRPSVDEHGRPLAPEQFARWLGPACWEDTAGAMHYDIELFHRWLGLPLERASIEETAEMMGAMIEQLYREQGEAPAKVIVRGFPKNV